jgi:predicted deacylase
MNSFPSLGGVSAKAGSIQYGKWEAFQHPTGTVEFLPIVIAQGKQEGPCIWLTAGIHGPEQAGPLVIYRLITQELIERLKGTIVAVPALNPAGLRTMKREAYHESTDPNRLWPDGKPKPKHDPYKDPPSSVETAYKNLFEEIIEHVDLMIDYHNAWTGSLSFSFRDRVLYRKNEDAEKNKAEAEALAEKQLEMLRAYRHTIITEMPAETIVDEDLHRSTSAAVLLLKRVPAITVELGTGHMPDPRIITAAAAGTRNILRWAGMLDGEMEPINHIQVVDPGYAVRRIPAPRMKEAGVAVQLLQPGEFVKPGDPVAEVRDIWGRSLGEGMLYSDYEGFVIGRSHGIFFYPGEPIYSLAVRDDQPVVGAYPEKFFEVKP